MLMLSASTRINSMTKMRSMVRMAAMTRPEAGGERDWWVLKEMGGVSSSV